MVAMPVAPTTAGASHGGMAAAASSSTRSRAACWPMSKSWSASRRSLRACHQPSIRRPMLSAQSPHENLNTPADATTSPAMASKADPIQSQPAHGQLAQPITQRATGMSRQHRLKPVQTAPTPAQHSRPPTAPATARNPSGAWAPTPARPSGLQPTRHLSVRARHATTQPARPTTTAAPQETATTLTTPIRKTTHRPGRGFSAPAPVVQRHARTGRRPGRVTPGVAGT